MKTVLTIAGSDCSGGAGIQADLKTFAAHKAYGMSVITSLTAQNTLGVSEVFDLPSEFVENQIDAVFTDIFPDAVKIGMVSNEKIINAIVKKLKKYKARNIVLDPVMVATSGSVLLQEKAYKALIEELIPIADIVTPNMEEASIISKIKIKCISDMEMAAQEMINLTEGAVLIKGGHLKESADDLFCKDKKMEWLKAKRVVNPNTHGTGCTLSSAIAVNLANEMSLRDACLSAKEYLTGALECNLNLGRGKGPLNHLYLQD